MSFNSYVNWVLFAWIRPPFASFRSVLLCFARGLQCFAVFHHCCCCAQVPSQCSDQVTSDSSHRGHSNHSGPRAAPACGRINPAARARRAVACRPGRAVACRPGRAGSAPRGGVTDSDTPCPIRSGRFSEPALAKPCTIFPNRAAFPKGSPGRGWGSTFSPPVRLCRPIVRVGVRTQRACEVG